MSDWTPAEAALTIPCAYWQPLSKAFGEGFREGYDVGRVKERKQR
ncbi:hypothetical protein [Epidermidibacterium keratini]|nr:hypothetical protein [Epidermidibacterium keratini]